MSRGQAACAWTWTMIGYKSLIDWAWGQPEKNLRMWCLCVTCGLYHSPIKTAKNLRGSNLHLCFPTLVDQILRPCPTTSCLKPHLCLWNIKWSYFLIIYWEIINKIVLIINNYVTITSLVDIYLPDRWFVIGLYHAVGPKEIPHLWIIISFQFL